VTTPPHSHRALAGEAIDGGAHVYVEKPFAVDTAEARDLIAHAERRDRKLTVGWSSYFDPVALEMRRRIARGDLGEPVHVESSYGYDLDGTFGQALLSDRSHWVHRLPGKLFHNIIDHPLNKIVEFLADDEPGVHAVGYSLRPKRFGDTRDALCANPELKKPDSSENGRSLGFLLQYGKFRFLDLGDLTWNKEIEMVCPVNRLGRIDLLQVNHHGMDLSGAPPFVHSLGARVAVMNNGPRKGGIGSYLDVVRSAPGLEDLWQLHLSLVTERERNTRDDYIANFEEEAACTGHYLKASIAADGNYTITNNRNNVSKSYTPR